MVAVFVLRTASARLAKTTVSHSHTTVSQANHDGSMNAWIVLQMAPISTMNMTGLRHNVRGSSLRSAPGVDFHSICGSSRPPCTRPFCALAFCCELAAESIVGVDI